MFVGQFAKAMMDFFKGQDIGGIWVNRIHYLLAPDDCPLIQKLLYHKFVTSIFLKFMTIRASSNVLEDKRVNDPLPLTMANHL